MNCSYLLLSWLYTIIMTLIIAAQNRNSIIVGSDSLSGRLDSERLNLNAQKLYDVSSSCSIMVAGSGFNSERVDQFLLNFIDFVNEQGITDIDEIANALNRSASQRIAGQVEPGNLIFILAGFSGTTPRLYKFHSNSSFQKTRYDTAYVAAGKDEFAGTVCSELGVNKNMTTNELKTAIELVLEKTHDEFPNEVGGDLTIKVLTS